MIEGMQISKRKKKTKFKNKKEPICTYCGRHIKYLVTVDHVEALANGGNDSEKNFTISCARCNEEKSNMDSRQFKMFRKYKEFLKSLSGSQLKERKDVLSNVVENINVSQYLKKSIWIKIRAIKSLRKNKRGLKVDFVKIKMFSIIKKMNQLCFNKKGLIKLDKKLYTITHKELNMLKVDLNDSNSFEELIINLEKFAQLVRRVKYSDITNTLNPEIQSIESLILALLDKIDLFLYEKNAQ